MPKVVVDAKKCIGCGNCVSACPVNVFDMKDGKSVPNRMDKCTECGECAENCPTKAIKLNFKK